MDNKSRVYLIFLWHAFFLAITMSMIDFNTIFPSLISSLNDSKIIFGALYSIMLGVPFIFNIIFGHYLKSKKFKKKYLLLGINFRAFSFLGMAFFTLEFAVNNPDLVVISFIFWIFLFSFSGGFAGIVYTDLIGKLLNKGDRGNFFAFKQFSSSIGLLIGGLIVIYAFDTTGLTYPINYALILFLGFMGLIVASGAFWLIKEPPSEVLSEQESLGKFMKKLPEILKSEKDFSRFLVVENLTSVSLMIIPFYIIFIQEIFDVIPLSLFLMATVIGTIISNFFWGSIAKFINSKAVITVCIAIGASLPILSLILVPLGVYSYLLIFLLIGFIRSGRRIGFDPYFLDIVSDKDRTILLGIRGTLNILTVVFPLIGGLIIEIVGFTFTFYLVTIIMTLSLIFFTEKIMKEDKI